MSLLSRTSLLLLCLLALLADGDLWAQRGKPPVPDHTAGGQRDKKHDWTLGPTGARGWMWGWRRETTDARQILVTKVDRGTPADGKLKDGDVILGVEDADFTSDARKAFGAAITRAEAADGKLALKVWREGRTATVTLKLEKLGAYAETAPFDCKKSEVILRRACRHIASNMKGGIDGMVNAMALLATGRRAYLKDVRALARRVARGHTKLTLEGRTSGLFSWEWGYRTVFLSEYYGVTRDKEVLPAIRAYANHIARGQSGVGSWGHGMAWPDLNEGELHGSLGGYGAVNSAGLVCHLGLVLAKRIGVQDPEVDAAIERANSFARFYCGKGAIPYGDHRPNWQWHDDNGKNSTAALVFALQGMKEEAAWFSRMTVASYGEREQGHTGNYFSYLWGPLGAAISGDEGLSAFLAQQRWYYDMARKHDGSFPYQGGAGMDGGEHKYGKWDCTGIFVLASTMDRKQLFLTGKERDAPKPLSTEEVASTIAAGAGYSCWDDAEAHFDTLETKELMSRLRSWSPAERFRAAKSLAKKQDVPTAALVKRLKARTIQDQLGACQALGALGNKAKEAVPSLTRTLKSEDVWLRIQAAYALAAIGKPAEAAIPTLLKLAVQDDQSDPRGFTQRYLAVALFYRGGALGQRGLLSRSLDGVDRRLLYPAIRRLLQNDDGRARAALESVYRNLSFDELRPILPAIVEAVRTPSPSGVMFNSGIRLAGLDLLAKHGVAEGMELAVDVMSPGRWGQQDRIKRCLKALAPYGAAARPILPRLEEVAVALETSQHRKAFHPTAQLVRKTMADIESASAAPRLRTLEELTRRR